MSHILTLVASDQSPELTNKHFDEITGICSQHNLRDTGSEIKWLDQGKAGQIRISEDAPIALIESLRDALEADKIDLFVVNRDFNPKLFVADMESTIISNEILDDLAKIYDIESEIKNITERGMKGEIDFSESLRERVRLLKGITLQTLEKERDSLELNAGAQILVRTLSRNGVISALVTGGFTFFSEKIAKICGFDYHHANVLDIVEGKLGGLVRDPILDKDAKAHYMNKYLNNLGLSTKNAIAIGDGANDLAMLTKAGLGIGYHPKPIVKKTIKNCIIHGDLTTALYALGYSKSEFVK